MGFKIRLVSFACFQWIVGIGKPLILIGARAEQIHRRIESARKSNQSVSEVAQLRQANWYRSRSSPCPGKPRQRRRQQRFRIRCVDDQVVDTVGSRGKPVFGAMFAVRQS